MTRSWPKLKAMVSAKRLDFVGLALVAMVISAMGAVSIWRDYNQTATAIETQLDAMARLAESEITSLLGNIDTYLDDISDHTGDDFTSFVQARSPAFPDITATSIVDSDGIIRRSSRVAAIGRSVGERSYLRHFHDNPAAQSLYLSEPIVSVTGTTAIFIARPLRDAQGRLTGVVVASVEPRIFARILESARPSLDSGAVSVLNANRVFLGRVPDADGSMLGKVASGSGLLDKHLSNGKQASVVRAISQADGIDRIGALRTSSRFPITIAISVAAHEVFAPWMTKAAWDLAMMVVVMGLAGGLALVGWRRDQERRRAATALAAERDFSARVIDSLPGVFCLMDSQGRLLLWNQNFASVFGYSESELKDGNLLDLFTGAHKTLMDQYLRLGFAHGTADADVKIVSRTGRGVSYYFTGLRCIINDQPRLLGIGLDISPLKALEVSLKRSNADLQQFAYVASHDLQEPLRQVSSYVQLLQRRYHDRLDADANDYITFAAKGAQRMSALINDLLDYSRATSRQQEFETVDCQGLVARIEDVLSRALAEVQGRIVVETPLPSILADASQMTSLFQNLIGNALKYRAQNRPPVIRVAARAVPEGWEFAIADNGIGIDSAYFDKLFIMFQRLHTREEYDGTGIGLAICKKIVERHGGRIWLDSTPGLGSTFYFVLPGGSGGEGMG
ncbi:MAG: PAS domain S-box protein [Magnetospirillum sp.]|nr:PAS domain S-box protein [Magnetospirillum sp.]